MDSIPNMAELITDCVGSFFQQAAGLRKTAELITHEQTESYEDSHRTRISKDDRPFSAAQIGLYLTGIQFILGQ